MQRVRHPGRVVAVVSVVSIAGGLATAGGLALLPAGWPLVTVIENRITDATGVVADFGVVGVGWRILEARPPSNDSGAGLSRFLDRLEVEFSAGPITLTDRQHATVLTARSGRFCLPMGPLLRGRVLIRDAELVEPVASLRVVDGVVAGIFMAEGASPSSLLVDVGHLHIKDGALDVSFVAKTPLDTVRVSMAGITATLDQRTLRSHDAALGVARTTLARGDALTTLEPFQTTVWIEGNGLLGTELLSFLDTRVASADVELSASGVVEFRPARSVSLGTRAVNLDIKLDGEAKLAALGAAARLPQRFSGHTTGTAHLLFGEGEPVLVEGEIDVEDLGVDRMNLGTLHSFIRVDDKHLELSGATWAIGDTTIRGSSSIAFTAGLPYVVEAEGLRLSAHGLFAALGLSRGPWVEARIDGVLHGGGTLAPFVLDGAGTGTATEIVVAGVDAVTATAKQRILTVTRPVHLDVSFHADIAGLTFAGAVDDELTRAHGTCQLWFNMDRGMLLDIVADHYSMVTGNGRIGQLAITGHGSGSLHIEGPYDGAVVTARVRARNLTIMGFLLGRATGTIAAKRTHLSFKNVVVHKGQSTYRGDVSLEFARSTRGRSPHLVAAVTLLGARAEDLRAIIPEDSADPGLQFLHRIDLVGPIDGRIDLQGFVGDGTGDDLVGTGRILGMDGLRLLGVGVPVGNLRFHFTGPHFVVDGVDF